MRIAIVAPYDLAVPGGVTNQVRHQAEALRRRGHAVQVYGPASDRVEEGETRVGGITTVNVWGTVSRFGLDPRSIIEVRAILRRDRFDIIHVHEPLTPIVPWLFSLFSRDTVLVGTFHVNREAGHHVYRVSWPLLMTIMRRLTVRIAVSEAARRTVARYFPGRYEIIPNGIDAHRFAQPRPRPGAMRGPGRYILFVGRLERRKGLPHLLRAFGDLRVRVPDARLIVVGEGPYFSEYQSRACAYGDAAQFTGRVSDDELPAYFQAADVVCSPAIGGESFGVVMLEALTAGKPVVASRIEGYADLLEPTGAARLVPAGDERALAEELTRVLLDDELRSTLGRRGVAAAAAYDWDRLALRLDDVYVRLLEERRRAG